MSNKHQEESRSITLPLGDVSMNSELGSYYIDMRPAITHYRSNIYGGKFDEVGVPMILDPNNDELSYFPINIAQYGFILHADYLESKKEETLTLLKACINKLMDLKVEHEETYVWLHNTKEIKYNIPAPWASAMAQGEIISLFLRYFQLTNDELYLSAAQKAYKFLLLENSPYSVRRYDAKGFLWFEEYPSSPPSYVLNGYIYTILGIYDLYRVTNDVNAKKDIESCIETLKSNLYQFDAGYWSYYDLLKKELVRYYYQKNVHVPQLKILYQLSNEPIFKKYAQKWEKTLTPFHFFIVKIMYRVLPRWRKLISYAKS